MSDAAAEFGFKEIDGSPKNEKINEDGSFSASRVFLGPYTSRIDFAMRAKGNGVPYAAETFSNVNVSHARVLSVAIEPAKGIITAGDDDTMNEYRDALVTINYGTKSEEGGGGGGGGGGSGAEPDEDDDTLVYEESISTSAEFVNLGSQKLFSQWSETPESRIAIGSNVPIQKLLVTFDWTITLYGKRVLPPDLATKIGMVNEKARRSPTMKFDFAIETLLYRGPRPRRQSFINAGVQPWDYSVMFTYRPIGWNKIYVPGSAVPIKPVEVGGGDHDVYEITDLSNVIPNGFLQVRP